MSGKKEKKEHIYLPSEYFGQVLASESAEYGLICAPVINKKKISSVKELSELMVSR